MAKKEISSPLRDELKKLSKPLGVRRFLSWSLTLPVLVIFLALPLLAFHSPELFKGMMSAQTASIGEANATDSKPADKPADPEKLKVVNGHPSLTGKGSAYDHKSTPLYLDSLWNPGPVASAHQAWADDCQACHVGNFERVQDASCTSCHGNMGLHVPAAEAANTKFTEDRCASCHRDHKGLESLAEQNKHYVGSDCSACHQNIKQVAPETKTLPVKDFAGEGHPSFRITHYENLDSTDLIRTRMKADLKISEPTNLKFPHDVHLDPKGIEGKNKVEVLGCADCHEAADTETGFKPIAMEAHCQDCHSLAFEPALPNREVPHGPSGPVLDTIAEFYGFLSQNPKLRQEVMKARNVLLARPGDREKPLKFTNLNASPIKQAEFAAQDLFENRACDVCHEIRIEDKVIAPGTPGALLTQYSIEPLQKPHGWMPMARFDHKAHEFESCSTCHEAGKSEKASDVLMKDIAVCQDCHAGQMAQADKVQSNCGLCHGYHMHAEEPAEDKMKQAQASQ